MTHPPETQILPGGDQFAPPTVVAFGSGPPPVPPVAFGAPPFPPPPFPPPPFPGQGFPPPQLPGPTPPFPKRLVVAVLVAAALVVGGGVTAFLVVRDDGQDVATSGQSDGRGDGPEVVSPSEYARELCRALTESTLRVAAAQRSGDEGRALDATQDLLEDEQQFFTRYQLDHPDGAAYRSDVLDLVESTQSAIEDRDVARIKALKKQSDDLNRRHADLLSSVKDAAADEPECSQLRRVGGAGI